MHATRCAIALEKVSLLCSGLSFRNQPTNARQQDEKRTNDKRQRQHTTHYILQVRQNKTREGHNKERGQTDQAEKTGEEREEREREENTCTCSSKSAVESGTRAVIRTSLLRNFEISSKKAHFGSNQVVSIPAIERRISVANGRRGS